MREAHFVVADQEGRNGFESAHTWLSKNGNAQ
jgi:hypothetical protein